MKCLSCQQENPPGLKFCGECGARMSQMCPSCGTPQLPGQKFCGECGIKLTVESSALTSPTSGTHDSTRRDQGSPVGNTALDGERRQLTVMFCDLVGSTALTQELDPEPLRELMHAYQQACRTVIDKYDGHVAQYLGDGLMIYFGWPKAHEDDAERAIRASLEIVDTVKKVLLAPEPLQVRIGIATGPVVVGETGAGDASIPKVAVGETPNLAARLQGLSDPDQIVIALTTHRLLGVAFEYADLGEKNLKGFVEPVRAFRILRAARTEGRFEATHGANLIPLVGRDEEIGLLMRRWEAARQGEGQVVLLCGEPGIGKSRITRALRERVAGEPHVRLRYQCSPFHTNSALHPVIEQFERAAAFTRDDGVEQKLDKLESLLREGGADIPVTAPLIATLLSLPAGRYPALNYSPQKQKEKMLEALSAQVEGLAAKSSVLMMFEDLHWVDPTTQELLDLIVSRLGQHRVLLVATYRPEYSARWIGQPHVTTINLSRLSRRVGEQMVRQVAGEKRLPDDVLQQILVKTDGVPLFVEELTKATLESGLLRDCGDRYELTGPLTGLAIPSTLQDSLMARLDRLAPVKEVAQIGACIGRAFGYELLSVVWSQGDRLLQEALDQLAQSDLVSRRGTPPDALYAFKHALVQDAAYDSLLRSRRAELHARIARAFEKHFPETAQSEPELIAHHYSAAGEPGLAAPLWLRAGRRALGNMALTEAIAHLQRGLAELPRLKNPAERESKELDLRVALGAAWMGLGGWFNPNVPLALDPAWSLAKKHGRRELMAPMIWGLVMHLATTGRLEDSLTWVQKFVDPTDVSASDDMWIVLEMTKCVCLFWRGDLLAAKQSVDAVLATYKLENHGHIATLTNHDPKTLMAIYRANLLWLLGYPDQALEATRELDRIARERGHFFDQGFAWTLGGWAYVYCGMPDEFEKFIEKAYRVGIEQSLPFFPHVQVPIHRGYVFFERQKYREAVDASRVGAETWLSLGGGISMPHALAYWAAAHARLGEVDQGLEIVERGIEQACRPGWLEQAHLAELLRVKGTLLELKGDVPAAETVYLTSLRWARTQQAKSLELRTATSYARLMQSQDRREEALQLLRPIYGWFTEGFDTNDLKETKALLEALRS